MNRRAEQFRLKLAEAGIEAAFLVNPHNVFYFAGYASVCSGVTAFADAEPVFCTLWLDAPEAVSVCDLRVKTYVFPRDRLISRMIEFARKKNGHIARIGVEKDFLVLRDYELLVKAFPQAEIVHVTPLVDQLRAIKDPHEIKRMEKSAHIADQAMEAALAAVRPGVTEIEIAAEAEYVMRKLGSERPAFGTFVASGDRTLLAHPHATHRRVEAGNPVVIDLGATWEGYASDLCRTTFAGEPTEAQKDHLRVILEVQGAAAAVLRDGVIAGEVFDRAYEVARKYKMANLLPNDLGYGVGLRQSEFFPIIEKGSPHKLRQDMVVALMQTTLYRRAIGGLRVEDTFHITPEGSRKLTRHIQSTFD